MHETFKRVLSGLGLGLDINKLGSFYFINTNTDFNCVCAGKALNLNGSLLWRKQVLLMLKSQVPFELREHHEAEDKMVVRSVNDHRTTSVKTNSNKNGKLPQIVMTVT